MTRFNSVRCRRKCLIASISATAFAVAGCGGGGNNAAQGPVASPGAPASLSGSTATPATVPSPTASATESGSQSPDMTAPPANDQQPPATNTPPPPSGAPVIGNPPPTTPPPASTLAPLSQFAYFKLGALGRVGTASMVGTTLNLDGRQYPDARLTPGRCSISGNAFTQCSSMPTQTAFELCGTDGGAGPGTDKIRSRYVLLDPTATQITDPAVLKNLTFDGYENCGQDNLGAQPKGAPSTTLSFDGDGNLTLTQFTATPARVSKVPSFFFSLDNDTVRNGVTARFNVFKSNGRYLIVATGMPINGATATDPGTMIAFMQR